MAVLMIEYRLPTEAVSSYEDWKKVFDTDPVGRASHGATGHSIQHDHRDENHFLATMKFGTVDEAERFLNEPMMKQSWEISGAGQSWLLVETETVTY
jgi:hypothetical protein